MQSGATTKDYCSRFWCHDIYTGGSESNPAIERLFSPEFRNRLDAVVGFDALDEEVMETIVVPQVRPGER